MKTKIKRSVSSMNKILLALMLALLVALLVTSCNGDAPDGGDTGSSLGESVVITEAGDPSEEGDSEAALPSDTDGVSPEDTTAAPEDSSDNGDEVTADVTADVTAGVTAGVTAPTLELETKAPADTETAPDIDLTPYKGIMIAKVYGHGGNHDGALEHSFIQLYNATDKEMPLDGLSLYYKSKGGAPFSQFPLPDGAVIPAGGYYLIRGEAAPAYDKSFAVMAIENFDAEWDITIDNKEVSLMLAPEGLAIASSTDVTSYKNAVSVFYAHAPEQYCTYVYAVDNMSKNKVAVRTALKDYSGYHKVNLSEVASPEITKICPVTSDGRENNFVSSRLNEVYFSVPAGLYGEVFTLELSAAEGYDIYYTTDGSNPKDNPKAIKYTAKLLMRDSSEMAWGPMTRALPRYVGGSTPRAETQIGGHVIKAYATNGTDSTGVYTSTYFVLPELVDLGVTLMSMSINQEEMVGPNGFYIPSNYAPGGDLTAQRPRGLAMLEVFDRADGQRVGYSNVEVAVSGNGSATFAMKSLRLYYKGSNNMVDGQLSDLDYDLFQGHSVDSEGEAITSFSRILLRNSGNDYNNTCIRDVLMQRTAAELNIDYMEYEPTLVFVNGEFWGLYNTRERYSGEYFESHYGIDKDNIAIIENDYSVVYKDNDAPYIVSSGIEGDADSFNELFEFIRNNNMADSDNYEYVCSQLDIDSLIDMYVVHIFYGATDWPGNNMKVWRNRNPEDPSGFDTKWHFTLLDLDFGLMLEDPNGLTGNIFGSSFNSSFVCGNIVSSLKKNSNFSNKFVTRYYEILTEIMTPENLKADFDEIYDMHDTLYHYQAERWGASKSNWKNMAPKIYDFLRNRHPYALNAMYSFFGVTEDDVINGANKRVAFSFHPDRVAVDVNGEKIGNGEVLKFLDDRTQLVINVHVADGYELSSVTITDRDGKVTKCTSSTIIFDATMSCSVSVAVKSKTAEPANPLVKSGLVAGPAYMFYLTETGDLYAWGSNHHGILGLDSSITNALTPMFVMSNVAKVATTEGAAMESEDRVWSTAILTLDGKLYTVGSNTKGQLGRNGVLDSSELAEVEFSGKITDVSVGYDHMLVLDDKGNVYGVGSNSNGQLGSTNFESYTTSFVKIASRVSLIGAGRRSTVYVDKSAKMYGLGDNRWRKIDQSGVEKLTSPTLMLENVAQLISGEHQILAITKNNELYYAGWRNLNGFTTGGGNNPSAVKLMSNVAKADIYFSDVVILDKSGDAYVYGLNTLGAIGTSVTGGKPKLFRENVKDVATGYGFTAYITDDGKILVNGSNLYGQAGNGSTSERVTLAEVDLVF